MCGVTVLRFSVADRDPLQNRTAEYAGRDLFAEGEWPAGAHHRYGGVVFDGEGRLLLREPANHFGGYHWTFPKGQSERGESPLQSALRETLEETGRTPIVVGHVPGVFKTGQVGTCNYFFLMCDVNGEVNFAALNNETWKTRWATRESARSLISESTLAEGRERDQCILDAAFEAAVGLVGRIL
jgi:8-oxo-dGTP pyrophosphatase MutT (NUDIX family)